LLADCWFGVTLVDVDPYETREVLRCKGELCPVFAAFVVAFVCGGGTEGQRETDDETEDCKEKLVDADYVVSEERTLRRSPNIRSCTNFEIHVIMADQPPTKSRGSIISGVMLPWRRKKIGHFEW
jgi:hypothetical protein